jgi:hypothetical protein
MSEDPRTEDIKSRLLAEFLGDKQVSEKEKP